jgi:hypothetical protein
LTEADRLGLTNWLKATDPGRWEMNADTGIAKRSQPLASAEVDACGACHSRRRMIAKDAVPGAPLLDSYAPAYLEPGLYHADGQIDGEVFEYGPFLQSRMFRAGVTCSNCHEPHRLNLRSEGNGLCAQCHLPAKFDGPNTIITNPVAPARSASTVTCRPSTGWAWIAGMITAFAFHGRICRPRSARRRSVFTCHRAKVGGLGRVRPCWMVSARAPDDASIATLHAGRAEQSCGKPA